MACKINISNRSGGPAAYYFYTSSHYTGAGNLDEPATPVVFNRGSAAANGTYSLDVEDETFAVVGSSSQGLSSGAVVSLTQAVPVQLGASQPGTTVPLLVDSGNLQLETPLPSSGRPMAFSIKTGNNFSGEDAERDGWLIGVGGVSSPSDSRGPAVTAVFTPEPNAEYQINPSKLIFVVAGNAAVGTIIDQTGTDQFCIIEADNFPSWDVTHLADGTLTFIQHH